MHRVQTNLADLVAQLQEDNSLEKDPEDFNHRLVEQIMRHPNFSVRGVIDAFCANGGPRGESRELYDRLVAHPDFTLQDALHFFKLTEEALVFDPIEDLLEKHVLRLFKASSLEEQLIYIKQEIDTSNDCRLKNLDQEFLIGTLFKNLTLREGSHAHTIASKLEFISQHVILNRSMWEASHAAIAALSKPPSPSS